MNKPDKKRTVIEKVANLEILLDKLEDAHDAATYHRNQLVDQCVDAAQNDLKTAVIRLAAGEVATAECLAEVAALRVDFSRRLLEAEAVEHELGESDFLELSKTKVHTKDLLPRRVAKLEQELLSFITELT